LAFDPKPEKVIFSDFDANKSYKQKVRLTNISPGYNSYKVGEIPLEFQDIISIKYIPPGRMMPGTTASITARFNPKQDHIRSHIIFNLPLICENGWAMIPIECRPKICSVRISCRSINFGSVVMGEKKIDHVSLLSEGALGTRFVIYEIDQNDEIIPLSK